MANKLYPPQIEGSLPAFYLKYDPTNTIIMGADIVIPFSMNAAVSVHQIDGFVLRLRTASSSSYLFAPIYSTNFNLTKNFVTFNLSKLEAQKLNEGQFYKVQIAYFTNSQTVLTDNSTIDTIEPGYFSTVGIIKCTSQPTVYINNLTANNVNFFTNDFIGVYNQEKCLDQSEKVYSYEFIIYDEEDEIYFTTGEKLHQTSYDVIYNQSIDKISINDFIAKGVTYSIQYKVITMNGLELTSPKYKITNENLVSPNKNITIIPTSDEDNGYININFKGDLDLNRSQYYVLNEEKISNEIVDGEYIRDTLDQSIISIVDQIKNYAEKITFLKTHTLFKYYENGQFYYQWNINNPENTIRKRINDKIKFFNKDLIITNEDISTITTYYEVVSTGRDLIKNISYQYAKDQYINVDKEKGILETTTSPKIIYHLIDSVPHEAFYFGSYILARASDKDNYSTWSVINRFKLDNEFPSNVSIKDITVEHGRNYKYSLQQYNIWGLVSSRILSEITYAKFEDMYLYDGEKALKIRYNPKVDSFKINLLEQKTDTIGGQYPYITRNGATWYRQFPIGGLITQELDTDENFINRNYGLAHRHSTNVKQNVYDYDGKIIENGDIPKNALRDFRMFSDENILLEREFKNAILEWLNDGNPKLFKSPYEGNYIVRLMQNTLTPVNELGRMLHNFTSQAYEIAECNYANLVKYGFIKAVPPSEYSGLWRTYNLTDPELKDKDGDINIKFDVGLVSFTVQDMMPGDIIYLLFNDSSEWEQIMIGITGSYTYVSSDRVITRLKIHPFSEIDQTSFRNISGVLNCYYQGVKITAFDSIIDQKLITIPSQQFIGVNPFLQQTKHASWIGNDYTFGLNTDQYRELQNYNILDFLNNENILKLETTDRYDQFRIIDKDKFQNIIATFEPGELLDKINFTINDGQTNKIELLEIEQAKFRVREIIPVYTIKEPKENEPITAIAFGADSNGSTRIKYEKKDGNTNIQYVATSPYGYPHPIEELTNFELIDPYCIFEVFEKGNDGQWQPVDNNNGIPYYDAYYKTWLHEDYNPTYQINYKWKKIKAKNNNNDVLRSNALTLKENGQIYNEDDIFDYYLYREPTENNTFKYFYYNQNNEKKYFNTGFDVYFKDKGSYYCYGNTDPFTLWEEAVYYIKEYDTIVSLATVKEQEYQNLKDINSIKIGNGIIAELTFQIKVVDYYTEVSDDDVRQAKEEYLKQKNFYSNLTKNYSIVSKAHYASAKYQALYNTYNKLLNGTHHNFLTTDDQNILSGLLKNSYEVEQLNLLKLYNVKFINNNLPLDIFEKIISYKMDNINKINFNNFENELNVFELISPETGEGAGIYFVINSNDIKYPTVEGEEQENQSTYYLSSLPALYSSDGKNLDIIFAVNKNDLIQKLHIGQINIQFLYADDYNSRNIENLVVSKNLLYTNNGTRIGELSKVNEQLTLIDEKWYLLDDIGVQNIMEAEDFVSIEEVAFENEQSTPLPFYEQKELMVLANSSTIIDPEEKEIEGVSQKLNDLNDEVEKLNIDINQLLEIVSAEKNVYISLLTTLKNDFNDYNDKVYKNWAYTEICKLLNNEIPIKSIYEQFTDYGENIKEVYSEETSKTIRLLTACSNLYNTINENLPKIKRFTQMAVDATEKFKNLQEHLKAQIQEIVGETIICFFAYYQALVQLNQTEDDSKIRKHILNYKEVFAQISSIENEFLIEALESYLENLQEEFISNYQSQYELLQESEIFKDVETFTNLTIWFDDLNFVKNIVEQTNNINLEFQNILNESEDKSEIASFFNKFDNKFNFNGREILIQDPIKAFDSSLRQYTATEIINVNNAKDRYTYHYRQSVKTVTDFTFSPIDDSSTTTNPYTTFIFYPTSTKLIEEFFVNNIQYESNNAYFLTLSEEEQKQVLEVSQKLNEIIQDFYKYIYREAYGDKSILATWIRNQYLDAEKEFNTQVLTEEGEKLIKINESNAYSAYMNKIFIANSKVKKEYQLPQLSLGIYKYSEGAHAGEHCSRPWFLIDETWPQSIMYTLSKLVDLSDINENEDTGEIEIQSGLYDNYLQQLGEQELETKKIILEQALKLLDLYQQQYDNYFTKLEQYNKEFIEQDAIFSSYQNTEEGQEVLAYYKSQIASEGDKKTIEQYRDKVREAWWKFFRILDTKYSQEKKRGMYA